MPRSHYIYLIRYYPERHRTMTRLDLLNRVITAAALVALAVTLGVWLTRSPLTAAPAATTPPTVAPLPSPVKSSGPPRPCASRHWPRCPLRPLSPPTRTTEVQVEVEIAPQLIPPAPVVTPPAAKPADAKAEPQSN